jgi:hypothetical protein
MSEPYANETPIRQRGGERRGRVVAHLGSNADTGVCGYFVVWDDAPGVRVYVTSERIEPAG